VRAADADDARVVHHLHQDHHVIRASARSAGCCCRSNSARAASSAERQQAALGERAVLGMIVLAAAAPSPCARRLARARFRRQRRHMAIGGSMISELRRCPSTTATRSPGSSQKLL
jgi:hypothetical protein